MTNPNPTFSLLIPQIVGDEFDMLFSGPLDALIAFDQLYLELPRVHRPHWLQRLLPNFRFVYRGRVDWVGVDFVYVQHGERLFMLACGHEGTCFRRRPHVLFGDPCDEVLAHYEHPPAPVASGV